jgi:hypothetical protein
LFIHPIHLITNISPVIDLLKKHTQASAKRRKKRTFYTPLPRSKVMYLTWVDNGLKRFLGRASRSRNKDLCAGKYPTHHVFDKNFNEKKMRD